MERTGQDPQSFIRARYGPPFTTTLDVYPMRLLDGEKQVALWTVQIYLTPAEATKLVAGLNRLLVDPEANEHEHILSAESGREISVSLITPTKLKDLRGYTSVERKMFEEK